MRFVEISLIGRVQGVGLRAAISARAISFGISGWVRNEDDGSVRLRLEGEEGKISEFIGWLSTMHSPYGIDISKIVQESAGEMEEKTKNVGSRFDILD